MSIKAALFACVIAAGVGCRGDRSSEETGYGNPVESTDPAVSTTHSDEAGHTVHETGAGAGAGVESGPSHASDYPVDETDRTDQAEQADRTGIANENTGADVTTGRAAQGDVQARRAATGARRSSPAPQQTGSFSMGMGTRYSGTGLNETASGNGTTTNTGTNTENAGNGNTDNPNQ